MTSINTARRAFFKAPAGRKSMQHRMPWAVADYIDRCQRCGDCLPVCQENVIVPGDGGFPTVDFNRGGCTFCAACVDACTHGALGPSQGKPWYFDVAIAEGCLSAQGITCRACGDVCDQQAIRFRLELGGRAIPSLETSLCNGCGSCIATCPTHVIQIQEAA